MYKVRIYGDFNEALIFDENNVYININIHKKNYIK